ARGDLPALAEVAGRLGPGALGGAASATDGAVEVLGADGAGLHRSPAGERGGAGGGHDGSTPWVGSALNRRRPHRLSGNDYSHSTRSDVAWSILRTAQSSQFRAVPRGGSMRREDGARRSGDPLLTCARSHV